MEKPRLARLVLLAVFSLPLPTVVALAATDTTPQCLDRAVRARDLPCSPNPAVHHERSGRTPAALHDSSRPQDDRPTGLCPAVRAPGDERGRSSRRSAGLGLARWATGAGPQRLLAALRVHERAVDSREGSVLQVRVLSTDGSELRVEILGQPPDYEQVVLTPEGGRYELRSGAILDVPPGAVDMETPIGVCGLSAASAQSRLDTNVLQPQYLAAGFQGVPSRLVFNVPITVTLPSSARGSASDMPIAFVMEPRGTGFSLAATDLQHDPATGLLQARVSHFSESVYAFAQDAIKAKYDCKDKANWCRCYGHIEVIERSSDTTLVDECYGRSPTSS